MRTRRVLVSAALLLACAPKPADTGDDGGSSASGTGGELTSASETTPTTGGGTVSAGPTSTPQTASGSADGTATATATATATDPGTSTSTSTSTDTGDDTSGGGGLPGACAAVCMHFEMCAPGSAGPPAECAANCVDGFEVPSECAMATAAQWSCVAGLSCEEALKFLGGPDDPPPTSCLAELGAADSVCSDIGCGGEISGGDDFCELEQDCGDKVQNFACDLQSNLCTCTENDVPGMQCPEDGFCAKGPDEQRAAITACCSWVWK